MFKLLFIALFLAGLSTAANPGVKVGLSKRALDYAARKAVDIMASKITKVKLPEASGRKYRVYDTKLTRFNKPLASVSINPGSGLTIRLSRGALGMSARWRYKVWFWWMRGNVAASSSSITLSMGTGISTRNGRPRFSARACRVSLGGFRVRTSGSIAGWILNVIIGLFKGKIRRVLENEVCKQLIQVINVNANRELATLNLIAPINRHLKLNYYLTANPTFRANGIESSHNGKALYDYQPFNPPWMSLLTSRMIAISLSEDTFNSVGRVLHRRRLFSYNFNINHRVIRQALNSTIRLAIDSTSAPTISIKPSGAEIKLAIKAVLSAGMGLSVTIHANASARLRVYVSGDRIRASILAVTTRVNSIQPSIPNFVNILNRILPILEMYVKWRINPKLFQGMPLPKVKDVRFTNAIISMANRHFKVATNVV